jgi:hypothetical protein
MAAAQSGPPVQMVRLTFIYMEGCGACKAAKKPLEKFESKHKKDVVVLRHDLINHPWTHEFQVDATPTYFIEAGNGHPGVIYTGALDDKDLEKLLARAKQEMKIGG